MGFFDQIIASVERFIRGVSVGPISTAPTEIQPDTYFRHFVSDIKYNRGFFSISYTLEQEDLESDLVDELRSGTGITNEGYLDSFGYSREQFEGDPPFLYPEVEVGQE